MDAKFSLKISDVRSDLNLWPCDEQHDSLALIARQQRHCLFSILDIFPIYLENKWKWHISFHFHNAAHNKWQISAHLW